MFLLLHRVEAGQPRDRLAVGAEQLVAGDVLDRRIVEDCAFAGLGEDVEFVAEIAADRPVGALTGTACSPSRAKVRR
jgi:hypothetical protein